MRIVAVLDLLRGHAVLARAGQRARYRPVEHVAGVPIHDGNPGAVASTYRDRFGITELYVADLDAIQGDAPSLDHDAILDELAGLGMSVWLDAGTASLAAARAASARPISRVIVGLETLPSFQTLGAIVRECGSARVVFSLDLHQGTPIRAAGGAIAALPANAMAVEAARAGVTTMIVLDLARVGMGTGPNVDLLKQVRSAVPDVELLAGGGVGSSADLRRCADAGCDGVLLATALHDGRLGVDDVRAAADLQSSVRR